MRLHSKAILLVAFSAVLFGFYWVPVTVIESYGIHGAWAAVLMMLGGLLAALPFLIRAGFAGLGYRHVLGAVGIGSAFSLYSVAIPYTDIVRVVLLFYLAPAWSTIIECVFMGRRWSFASVVGLLLSFLGIVFIFRGELPLDGLGAVGDWLAVIAGLGWSIGSSLIFSNKRIPIESLAVTCFFIACVFALTCAVILDPAPVFLADSQSIPWNKVVTLMLVCGVFYLLPLLFITLWGAGQLPPATMSFLLTIEVVVAVASSAYFLGLQFGIIELIGTSLILAGAVWEVVTPKKLLINKSAT
jgi:drug/metabolite transporter (DMT)-like permease